MLSVSSYPAHRYSGESFNLPIVAVNYRQRKSLSLSIAAAYTSTAPERENATLLSPYLKLKTATSFYEVLGIPMRATKDEIKSAYRRLARIFHPDVAASTDRKSSSSDDFMRIHDAYSTLSDPGKRSNYDRQMFGKNGLYCTRTPASSRFSGYAGRNWETDQCW